MLSAYETVLCLSAVPLGASDNTTVRMARLQPYVRRRAKPLQLTSGLDFLSIQAYRLWMEYPSRFLDDGTFTSQQEALSFNGQIPTGPIPYSGTFSVNSNCVGMGDFTETPTPATCFRASPSGLTEIPLSAQRFDNALHCNRQMTTKGGMDTCATFLFCASALVCCSPWR